MPSLPPWSLSLYSPSSSLSSLPAPSHIPLPSPNPKTLHRISSVQVTPNTSFEFNLTNPTCPKGEFFDIRVNSDGKPIWRNIASSSPHGSAAGNVSLHRKGVEVWCDGWESDGIKKQWVWGLGASPLKEKRKANGLPPLATPPPPVVSVLTISIHPLLPTSASYSKHLIIPAIPPPTSDEELDVPLRDYNSSNGNLNSPGEKRKRQSRQVRVKKKKEGLWLGYNSNSVTTPGLAESEGRLVQPKDIPSNLRPTSSPSHQFTVYAILDPLYTTNGLNSSPQRSSNRLQLISRRNGTSSSETPPPESSSSPSPDPMELDMATEPIIHTPRIQQPSSKPTYYPLPVDENDDDGKEEEEEEEEKPQLISQPVVADVVKEEEEEIEVDEPEHFISGKKRRRQKIILDDDDEVGDNSEPADSAQQSVVMNGVETTVKKGQVDSSPNLTVFRPDQDLESTTLTNGIPPPVIEEEDSILAGSFGSQMKPRIWELVDQCTKNVKVDFLEQTLLPRVRSVMVAGINIDNELVEIINSKTEQFEIMVRHRAAQHILQYLGLKDIHVNDPIQTMMSPAESQLTLENEQSLGLLVDTPVRSLLTDLTEIHIAMVTAELKSLRPNIAKYASKIDEEGIRMDVGRGMVILFMRRRT